MATTLETFNYDILQPVQNPGDARRDAVQFGPSLVIAKGQAIGIKTSDNKAYPLNNAVVNEVQTLNFTNSPAGTFRLRIKDSAGVWQYTQRITYSATIATLLSNLQTATDAVLVANAIVWSGTLVTAVAGTFSGTGYAGIVQDFIFVDADALTAGDVDVTRTTPGGDTDGTGVFKGLSMYALATDANGVIYWNGGAASPSAGYRTPPMSTSPIYTCGTFDPLELETAGTPVAEVDTFTATNPTTNDVYTVTITFNDLSTHAVSATVGATQTATAITTLLKTAWAADPIATAYATATGTATFILTGVKAGQTLSLAGTTAGTGTVAKVVTTAASGDSVATILATCPGARVLHNGFIKIP